MNGWRRWETSEEQGDDVWLGGFANYDLVFFFCLRCIISPATPLAFIQC